MPPRTSTGVWGSLERAAATVIAMASPAQRSKPHTKRLDPSEPRKLQARPSSAAAAKRPKQTRATRNAPAAKKRKVTATRSVDATGSAAPAAAAAAAVSSGTTKPVDVQLKSMPTSQLKLVFDIINKQRGLDMNEVVPRELCRSGNREYLLKKLLKPFENKANGGLYVSDEETWHAVNQIVAYIAAKPKKAPKARARKAPTTVAGPSVIKSKGGRPPRLELIPKGAPTYTAADLPDMSTKQLVALFTKTYGHATKSSNAVWLRKSLMHALGPAALAELALTHL